MSNLQEILGRIEKFDLSGYKEEKYIGRGAYGSIILAKKENDYAIIKTFLNTGEIENINELIEREIKNISRCSKYNQLIIGFRGISFIDLNSQVVEYPLLILNYAKNGSLNDLLGKTNGDLPIFTKMILLYGIAKAMEIIHFHQIVHRDLKPENVLLNENDYPLLTDFGTSRTYNIEKKIQATPFVGTVDFVAPEILDETVTENNLSKSDVFSYGMLVYTILTGKRPFIGYLKRINSYTIVNFLQNKRFTLPDSIPSYYKQFISTLWDQNPNERPTFSEIIQFFKAGILLPEIQKNPEMHDKFIEYIRYLDMDEDSFKIDEGRLIELQNNLMSSCQKLSVAVTMFLADFCDNCEAQLKIGRYYTNGTFVDLNRELGFEYLNKAAAKKDPKAYYYLGLAHFYEIGCGGNKMYKDFGMQLIKESSKMGFQKATSFLENEMELREINKNNAPIAVIIGSITTGKTTFLNKLVDLNNNSLPSPTIGMNDLMMKCTDEQGRKFYVRLRDTMGMEKHNALVQSYMRDAKLVLVMFDLNDRQTFEDIDMWIENLLNDIPEYVRYIFIGNKIDKERFVSTAEASEKANEYNADYFEVSALTGQNIQYPLTKIVEYLKFYAFEVDINNNHETSVDIAGKSVKTKKSCCS